MDIAQVDANDGTTAGCWRSRLHVLATVVAEVVRAQANSDVQRMSSIILRQARVSHRYPIDERKGVYDLLQPTNTSINLVVRKILYPV